MGKRHSAAFEEILKPPHTSVFFNNAITEIMNGYVQNQVSTRGHTVNKNQQPDCYYPFRDIQVTRASILPLISSTSKVTLKSHFQSE